MDFRPTGVDFYRHRTSMQAITFMAQPQSWQVSSWSRRITLLFVVPGAWLISKIQKSLLFFSLVSGASNPYYLL